MDLVAFLQECEGGAGEDLARKKAQGFADRLDRVRHLARFLDRVFSTCT